jgi:amphi-Trp domain-containing protein
MRRPAWRDIERTYSRRQFVEKLRRLADAIESTRAFTIQVASERLQIPADATFNVEHERSHGKHELEFQLRWREPSGLGRMSSAKPVRGKSAGNRRLEKRR